MIEQAEINKDNNNILQISGVLNYKTVIRLQQKLLNFISSMSSIRVELSKVEFSDSSGLALLVECLRLAKQQDKQIIYRGMPEQMQAMAQVMGLSNIFSINHSVDSHG